MQTSPDKIYTVEFTISGSERDLDNFLRVCFLDRAAEFGIQDYEVLDGFYEDPDCCIGCGDDNCEQG